MTQHEMNRAVARATGETVDMIERMGFSPLTEGSGESEPQTVDWDEQDELRGVTRRVRRRRLSAVA